MTFLGIDAAAGTITKARVAVGEMVDGTHVTLPVVVARGTRPGPTLYVQAGLHGDELTGIEICRRLIGSLDPAALAGTLVSVPLANPPAHVSRGRGSRYEERGPIDANRVWPGNADGLLTERIVDTLFQEFILASDFTVDLHSALEGCNIAPFVYVDPDDDESGTLELRTAAGRAFGTPYLYFKRRGQKLGTSDMSRSMRTQAELHGKPSISAEMGESHRITEAFVPIGVGGLQSLLRHLGMLDGEAPPREPQRDFSEIRLVHAEHGGGLRWKVRLGDDVAAGQPIAEIVDVFGDSVETIEAPATGFLLRQMLWGAVATGAEIAWVAR